jgi:hypothetical protein
MATKYIYQMVNAFQNVPKLGVWFEIKPSGNPAPVPF